MSEYITARRVAPDAIEVSLPHHIRLQSEPPMELVGSLRVHLREVEALALIEQLQVAQLYPARGSARA